MRFCQSIFSRSILTGLAAAICFLIAGSGLAAAAEPRVVISASVVSEQPMNFVLVQDKSCAPAIDCPRWIAGEGSIHADTPARLQVMLERLDGESLPLLLNSRGGEYEAAMSLGEIVANHNLSVVVAATGYPDCTEIYMLCRQVEGRKTVARGKVALDKGHCDFACVFVLAASPVGSAPKDLSMQMPVLSIDAADGAHDFLFQTSEPVPHYMLHLRRYARAHGAPRGDGVSITLPMPDAVPGMEADGAETPSAAPAAKPGASVSPSSAGQLIVAASVGKGAPMDFVLLELSSCAGRAACPRWISAEGMIDDQTPEAFRAFLAKTGPKGTVLMINSRGGDYEAAMELGRIARDRHLKIGLGRAVYPDCGAGSACRRMAAGKRSSPGAVMESGARCDLACVFFLAGGEKRRMAQDSLLTMPKIRLGEAGIEGAALSGVLVKTAPPDAPILKHVQSFLDDMGMYKALFVYGVSTRWSTLEPVSPEESSLYNLVSDRLPPSRLLMADVPVAPAPVVPAPPKAHVPAKTANSSEMRFYVVTTPDNECSGDCKSWIAGVGEITVKSPASLRKVLRNLGKRRLPIILQSQGGSVEGAMEIGRMIRTRKLSTGVGITVIDGCAGSFGDCAGEAAKGADLRGRVVASGAFCLSACPLILAGGVERLSSAYSFIGVHQITTVWQRYTIKYSTTYRMANGKRVAVKKREVGRVYQGTTKTTELSKAAKRNLLRYLAEMGIDERLYDRMMEAKPDDIRILAPNEARALAMTTGSGTARDLIQRP